MLKGLALAGVFAAALGEAAVAQTLIEDDSAVGYPSVAAAFEAVKADPNVHISVENDWTLIFDYDGLVRWDFSQPGNPAHPTLVRRATELPTKSSPMVIRVSVLCEAQKAECDKVKAEIDEENYHLR